MRVVSTVPAVLADLVIRIAAALPDVEVVDGHPITAANDMVCVGFSGESGEPAVESARSRDQVTLDPHHESYSIACWAYALRGDKDPVQVRELVYGYVNTVAAVLDANPILGGLVGRVQLATESLTQEQNDKGAQAELRFSIAVDAWTR
ncbi:hypothetical protein [Planobispora siamensis]